MIVSYKAIKPVDAFRDSFTSIYEKLCIECSIDTLNQINEGNTD